MGGTQVQAMLRPKLSTVWIRIPFIAPGALVAL